MLGNVLHYVPRYRQKLLWRVISKTSGYLSRQTIEMKDLSQGLVDFPAEMEGRRVYLCWMLGEDSVNHWHELDAGYAGRQSTDGFEFSS